jgi:hypothetical protein
MRLLFIFGNTFLFSTVIVVLIIYIYLKNNPYPSPARVDERGLAFILLPGMNIGLVLALCTMFLNLIKKGRDDLWFSFASFFALPIVLLLNLIPVFDTTIFVFYGAMFLPFFGILLLNFIFYRRYINAQLKRDV